MQHAWYQKHQFVGVMLVAGLTLLQGCLSVSDASMHAKVAHKPNHLPAVATAIGTGLLAFIASDGNDLELFAKDLTTGALQQLTHNNSDDIQPTWSPDGARLAYIHNQPNAGSDLYVLDLATGEHTQVTCTPQVEQRAVWLADSQHILFRRADAEARGQLFTVMAGSSCDAAKPFLDSDTGIVDASVSPDGNYIAYSERLDAKRNNLRVQQLHNRQPIGIATTLFHHKSHDVTEFSWLPNSDQLLVTTKDAELQTYLVDAQTGDRRAVGGQHSVAPEAQWLASNSTMYYLASPDRMRRQLHRLDIKSNLSARVSRSNTQEMFLSAAVDQPLLAFAQFVQGNFALHTLDARTGSIVPVAPQLRGVQMHPRFQPHNISTAQPQKISQ